MHGLVPASLSASLKAKLQSETVGISLSNKPALSHLGAFQHAASQF